jgi:hypothetical protein
LREEIDPGVNLGERVADAPGDVDRLTRVADRLRPLLQHLDLRAAGERTRELR